MEESNKFMRNTIIALATIIVIAGISAALFYNPSTTEEQCADMQEQELAPINSDAEPF